MTMNLNVTGCVSTGRSQFPANYKNLAQMQLEFLSFCDCHCFVNKFICLMEVSQQTY